MKLKSLLLIYAVLVFTVPVAAQSGTTGDSISGTWRGDMGPSETRRIPITVTLKFDGQTSVSGTITGPPQPGEIKTGTFDPKTGALKLEVEIKGDGNAFQVVFEGTIVSGTATGRVNGNNQTGNFKITKGSSDSGATPQPGSNEMTAALHTSFGEVSGLVIKAADLIPADKYAYRPAPSVRTFGQLIAHVADAYSYYCARGAGREVKWSDAIEKGNTDKATLAQKLKQATDACRATYGGTSQAGAMLFANLRHTDLHYGNIVTYVRMLGLVPPSN
jgi:uncharacterized damage-inducible protein DinB